MNQKNKLQRRINKSKRILPNKSKNRTISIKIQNANNSCLCREHCWPKTYQIIDSHLHSYPAGDFSFEEHEHGPEILLCITVGVSLLTGVINLVTAIINSGNREKGPIKLIISDKKGGLINEKVLRLN
ncbi:MAG: hypothetical protein HY762_02875 [Planctomycetes bacterium]|nr:hypothetical protein [Planctomycetota bacterium]